ncbi:protein disulfide-isomerase [Periophthalmus magnuspinnatus]|uniref:protein disulfide-isomerase n=1 Tax=Periophthalmus magnuspinnatus TaxID=409849 RepID=UPI00145B94E6|nr:protein disulfide-isomerase [Periophthalmus magnuspinnatus]
MRDKSLIILGVVTFCVCVSTAVEEDILQLNNGNFNKALREHSELLVHFYVPMTADVHKVSEAFQEAAAELQGSEVRFAMVDIVNEKDLAKKLNATEPPFIRLYLSGDKHNPVPCPVPKTSSSILTWLKRRAGSPTDIITDNIQSDDLLVVGFFKELNDAYIQVFYEAAIDLPELTFALTQNKDVVSKYDLVDDVILVLKKSRLMQAYRMRPETTKEELILFITVFQMDPVTEYSGETASQILSSPIPNHALLFISKTSPDYEKIYIAFNRSAAAFRLKILFVLVNVDESRNGRLLEYFRVRDFEAPLIRIVNLTDHVTYQLPSLTLDVDTIGGFCQDYLNRIAKPKLQSEPVPEGWEQEPVKQLVGSTLEKVAFHPNKTVFVLFYLPYSPQSRAVFPLWEELAEAFEDQEDVVIARMDASANDINMSMHRQYPSFCLFPALYAERVVVYTGKHQLKHLVKFVHKEMEKAKKDRVKEDEDRRKYMDSLREEEAKKANQSKDEL